MSSFRFATSCRSQDADQRVPSPEVGPPVVERLPLPVSRARGDDRGALDPVLLAELEREVVSGEGGRRFYAAAGGGGNPPPAAPGGGDGGGDGSAPGARSPFLFWLALAAIACAVTR